MDYSEMSEWTKRGRNRWTATVIQAMGGKHNGTKLAMLARPDIAMNERGPVR